MLLLLGVGCGTFIDAPAPESWGQVVVASPDEVPAAQLIDARSAEDYAAGHIPGAAQIHWTELTGPDADGLQGPLPPEVLAARLAERGISAAGPLLIYGAGPEGYGDDGDVYWTLRYLGRTDVWVLSGGWVGWLAQGGVPADGTDDAPAPVADFAVTLVPEVRASTEEVAGWSGVVLDVRSAEVAAFGHIPGAVWLEWTEAFGAGGALKAPETLREDLAALGITEETPVAIYCATGIRAGHTYMVLDALGYPVVKNYAGAWERWVAEGGAVAYPPP